MITRTFLEHLGIKVTYEGSTEITCDCPWCHKPKKLYVNIATGLYECKSASCKAHGNPYKMVKDLLNEPDPAKISESLGVYNITSTGDRPAQGKQQPQIPSIKYDWANTVPASDQELQEFCKLKISKIMCLKETTLQI